MTEESGESTAAGDSGASESTLPHDRLPASVSVEQVDIGGEDIWQEGLTASFDQQATLEIARWVLGIFAGVYLLAFIFAFWIVSLADAKFEGALEALKFLVTSILPLVTLAVGYYLGQTRNGSSE